MLKLPPIGPFGLLLVFLCLRGNTSVSGITTSAIEHEISILEAELATLPISHPSTLPWSRGVSWHLNQQPEKPVSATITFAAPAYIDLIAILPAAYPDKDNKLRPDGFPIRFYLERLLPDGSSEIIADYRENDYPTPGVEPQLFPCPSDTLTAGLKITSTLHLPNQVWLRPSHVVALNEIIAFSGEHNVALNAQVEAPMHTPSGQLWTPQALVDGFTHFSLSDRNLREPNIAYKVNSDKLVLDFVFEQEQQINEFRIWPLINLYYPPISGVGFPKGIKLEKVEENQQSTLYESGESIPHPGSDPYMRQITPTTGKHFRFTLSKPVPEQRAKYRENLSIEEIQLLSAGKILTNGMTPSIQNPNTRKTSSNAVQKLTDGFTSEGKIVPLRRWVESFHRRAQIEKQLLSLNSELDFARRQERERMQVLTIAGITAIILLALLVWIVRLLSVRKWTRIREQIAADLHDHVGANLSSIAHSNTLLSRTIETPSELQSELLEDSVATARSTASEAREIVKLLQDKRANQPLSALIKKTTRQILGDIEYTCTLPESLGLNPSQKWNLVLFLKEALNNVIKHSQANHVDIELIHSGRRVELAITDNGCGITGKRKSLFHLEKRATLLNGKLGIKTGRGTRITLNFKRGLFS
ncbi:sensor histidine kinase [Pelagicoccus mobilis]|uniref:histidine kinase n=1 Tax=Pelagicoccus mobilis TaxID=415221 RepID=A0A934VN94_9BACT|nr:histidine kinase [Pelagicoccus mobilis]MBK1875992.1 hypothetical protein [Pelagicoccus mobilis]